MNFLSGRALLSAGASAIIGVSTYWSEPATQVTQVEDVVDDDLRIAMCLSYKAGVSRDSILSQSIDIVLNELPASFWNMPNMSAFEQAALLSLITHDEAIIEFCPEYGQHLGTEEEYDFLLRNYEEYPENYEGQVQEL